MKKTYTITFKVDVNYPYVEKYEKRMAKEFDTWLKEWAENTAAGQIVPVLYEPNKGGAIEHDANGTVRVKIIRDKEVILNTWWDVLSKDF